MNRRNESDQLDRMADEFATRIRNGELPSIDEYVRRCPELADEIRNAFPVMMMMEEFAQTTGTTAVEDLTPHRHDELDRKQLGEYHLLREIGRGGMGVVYEAEHQQLGRRVALKVLSSSLSKNPRAVERFHREAKAAARLTHGNIVPIYEVSSDKDVIYYTMQLIRGYGLDTLIKELRLIKEGTATANAQSPASSVAISLCDMPTENTPRGNQSVDGVNAKVVADSGSKHASTLNQQLDDTRKSELASESGKPGTLVYYRNMARVGMQIADALAYANDNGVVHRDIKPGNLLVDALSNVWVTDFGLAKLEESDLTQEGDILGTLRYMAPEQLRGWADPRSDVYSLGMTLYELLVLRPALQTKDRVELMRDIVNHKPPSLRSIDRSVPHDLDTIIAKSIAKEPAERYQDCESLRKDLQNVVEFRPINARRATPLDYAKRWVARNRLLSAAAACCLLAILGWAISSTILLQVATKQKQKIIDSSEKLNSATISYLGKILQDGGNLANVREDLAALEEFQEGHWELGFIRRILPELPTLPISTAAKGMDICPNGKWFAGVDYWGEIRVWDTKTLEIKHIVHLAEPHLDGEGVIASPDGRHLVCRPYRKVDLGYIIDLQAEPVRAVHIAVEGQKLSRATFGRPNGEYLIALDQADRLNVSIKAYKVSDLKSGKPPKPIELELPFIGRDDTEIRRWDIRDGLVIATLKTSQGSTVECWDPMAKQIVGSFKVDEGWGLDGLTDDRYLLANKPSSCTAFAVWSKKNSNEPLLEVTRDSPLLNANLSPDGRFVAGSISNGEIIVYDIDAGQEIRLRGHENHVASGCIHFTLDSKQLISASYDSTVRVWDLDAQPDYFEGPPVKEILLSPDGALLATNTGGEISIWDAKTLQLSRTLQGHAPQVPLANNRVPRIPMAFSSDGKRLVTVTKGSEILIWRIESGEVETVIRRPAGQCENIRFHPNVDKPAIIANFGNSMCETYDMNSKTWRPLVNAGDRWLRGLGVSPNGKWVVTAGTQMQPQMVPFGSTVGEKLVSFRDQKLTVFDIEFSPDSSRVAFTGKSRFAEIFDLEDPDKPVATLKGHHQNPLWMAFSSDGKRVYTVTSNFLRVFDPERQRQMLALRAREGTLMGVEVGPGGTSATVYTGGDRLRVWEPDPVDTATYRQRRLHRHAQRVVERLRSEGPRLNAEVIRAIDQDASLSDVVKRAAKQHLSASGEDIESLFLAAWNFVLEPKESATNAATALEFAETVCASMAVESAEVLNLLGMVQYRNSLIKDSQQNLKKAKEVFAEEIVPGQFQFYRPDPLVRDRALNQLFLAMGAYGLEMKDATKSLTKAVESCDAYQKTRHYASANIQGVRNEAAALIESATATEASLP